MRGRAATFAESRGQRCAPFLSRPPRRRRRAARHGAPNRSALGAPLGPGRRRPHRHQFLEVVDPAAGQGETRAFRSTPQPLLRRALHQQLPAFDHRGRHLPRLPGRSGRRRRGARHGVGVHGALHRHDGAHGHRARRLCEQPVELPGPPLRPGPGSRPGRLPRGHGGGRPARPFGVGPAALPRRPPGAADRQAHPCPVRDPRLRRADPRHRFSPGPLAPLPPHGDGVHLRFVAGVRGRAPRPDAARDRAGDHVHLRPPDHGRRARSPRVGLLLHLWRERGRRIPWTARRPPAPVQFAALQPLGRDRLRGQGRREAGAGGSPQR